MGLNHAWARRFVGESGFITAESVDTLDLELLRSRGQPVISGAGWQVQGGYTEPRSKKDITVTIYGSDYQGNEVQIQGQLGGDIITPEKAHTLEHSIIRAYRSMACAPSRICLGHARGSGGTQGFDLVGGLHFKLPEIWGGRPA